jgi:hypothetical protein
MKLGVARMFGWVLVILVVGVLAYVRLAPSDPDRWHVSSTVDGMGEVRSASGYLWRAPVEGDGKDQLRALHAVAMATPRTTRLAGSVEDGRITYITRSQWFGFPDYTTIGIYAAGGSADRYLEINGRLRFGRSDLGVNGKRVKGWLSAIQG